MQVQDDEKRCKAYSGIDLVKVPKQVTPASKQTLTPFIFTLMY